MARIQRPAVSRDHCLTEAAVAWADTCARQAQLTPRQAAVEAYQPGGPSIDELETRIRARRATTRQQDAA
jgi:hypothetical protein